MTWGKGGEKKTCQRKREWEKKGRKGSQQTPKFFLGTGKRKKGEKRNTSSPHPRGREELRRDRG